MGLEEENYANTMNNLLNYDELDDFWV